MPLVFKASVPIVHASSVQTVVLFHSSIFVDYVARVPGRSVQLGSMIRYFLSVAAVDQHVCECWFVILLV